MIPCRNPHTCLGCFVSPNVPSCFLASLSGTICFPTAHRKQGRSSLPLHPAGNASSCSLEQQQELASFQPARISAEVNELGKKSKHLVQIIQFLSLFHLAARSSGSWATEIVGASKSFKNPLDWEFWVLSLLSAHLRLV